MLKTRNIAILHDPNDVEKTIEFEVNYDKSDKNLIRVMMDKKKMVIKKDDLWNMIFAIVEADKQAKMVPVEKTEMEKYIKQHTVILQKDLKKGDTMAVNCEVNVRKEVADAIRRELEEEKEEGIPSTYLQEK